MPLSNRVSASDILEPYVVLGQARRCRFGRAHITQLCELQLGLEVIVAWKAMQHRCHPPREVLGAPYSAKARGRVSLQRLPVTSAIPRCDRIAEHAHVGEREVHSLSARW